MKEFQKYKLNEFCSKRKIIEPLQFEEIKSFQSEDYEDKLIPRLIEIFTDQSSLAISFQLSETNNDGCGLEFEKLFDLYTKLKTVKSKSDPSVNLNQKIVSNAFVSIIHKI